MSSPNLPEFDALWDYSRPDQTETKFCEILLQIPEDASHPRIHYFLERGRAFTSAGELRKGDTAQRCAGCGAWERGATAETEFIWS